MLDFSFFLLRQLPIAHASLILTCLSSDGSLVKCFAKRSSKVLGFNKSQNTRLDSAILYESIYHVGRNSHQKLSGIIAKTHFFPESNYLLDFGYINALIVKLLPNGLGDIMLFERYYYYLQMINQNQISVSEVEKTYALMQIILSLMKTIGFGLYLDNDLKKHQAIQSKALYSFQEGIGFTLAQDSDLNHSAALFWGEDIEVLQEEALISEKITVLKRVIPLMLSFHLGKNYLLSFYPNHLPQWL